MTSNRFLIDYLRGFSGLPARIARTGKKGECALALSAGSGRREKEGDSRTSDLYLQYPTM